MCEEVGFLVGKVVGLFSGLLCAKKTPANGWPCFLGVEAVLGYRAFFGLHMATHAMGPPMIELDTTLPVACTNAANYSGR